ncbi:12914_t:CDS:1, partial [Gigaspora margarita]
LWTTYQYQYRKGLFITWLEKRKEKSMQQNEIVTDNKSVKEDTTNEIKIVTVE